MKNRWESLEYNGVPQAQVIELLTPICTRLVISSSLMAFDTTYMLTICIPSFILDFSKLLSIYPSKI